MNPYFVLEKRGESETLEKKSRFIGFAFPLPPDSEKADDQGILAFLKTIKKEYHDARHICFAWRMGLHTHRVERYSDDGEPSHTGGFPILQLLQGQEIENVLVVVVRYFGGIKLGPGGLSRAYRDCAKLAIESSGKVEVVPKRSFTYTIAYPRLDSLEHWIGNNIAIDILNKNYTDMIEVTFEIRKDSFDDSVEKLAAFLNISPDTLLGSH